MARMETDGQHPVRGFAEAINRFDQDAAVAFCDSEIEFLSVLAVGGEPYRGHDGIRQYFEDIESAWDEWRVEVDRVQEGSDGRVAIVMTMHWRGKESGTGYCDCTGHVWTLRNGKLLRNEPHRVSENALRALSLSP